MFNKLVELDNTAILDKKLENISSDSSSNFKIQVGQLKTNIEAKLRKEMKRETQIKIAEELEESKKEIQDLKEKNNQHNQLLSDKLKLIQELQAQATHNQLQLQQLNQEKDNTNEGKLHSLTLF